MAGHPVSWRKRNSHRKSVFVECTKMSCIILSRELIKLSNAERCQLAKIRKSEKLGKARNDVDVRMNKICGQVPEAQISLQYTTIVVFSSTFKITEKICALRAYGTCHRFHPFSQ